MVWVPVLKTDTIFDRMHIRGKEVDLFHMRKCLACKPSGSKRTGMATSRIGTLNNGLAASNKRLERTRLERASLVSCVGEPLKRGVRC